MTQENLPYERPVSVFQRIYFAFEHDTSIDLVDRARVVCLANQIHLTQLLQEGLVTQERLDEIAGNQELQGRYKQIIKDAMDGKNNKNDVLKLKYDQLAGWYIFYRNFFEKRWHIKLLTDEERRL